MPMMSESDGSLPFGGPGCVLAVGLPWGSLSGPGGCWTGSVVSCSHTGALWDCNSSETAGVLRHVRCSVPIRAAV